MKLFSAQIKSWDDWGDIFQSISAFTPLVEHIFHKENLPPAKIENLKPGTNAVFKVGEYVVKIFAPVGEDSNSHKGDYGTNVDVELFGMKLANERGVPAPKLIADGVIEDKYSFRYMIMDYINGKMLDEVEDSLSYEDKVVIGQNVRKITDKLNAPPCENFTRVDVMQYAKASKDWLGEGFPESLEAERQAYLADFYINERDKVYCHGDFHCQNIFVDDELNVYIVDFADAMYAPAEYELIYVVSALFCFEKPYMVGYFGGDYDVGGIVDLCMKWLPIHAWGHATTEGNLKKIDDITSFAILRERLYEFIKCEKEKLSERFI